MQFNAVYALLRRQIFTPSVKFACRVYMAKDAKACSKPAKQMQQLLGARWDLVNQKIGYDNLLLKKFARGIAGGVLLALAVLASL